MLVLAGGAGANEKRNYFPNALLLKLSDTEQKRYIDGVVSTLWQVAAQADNQIAQCIVDWYYGEKRPESIGLVFASLRKYPDSSPVIILMALTERECGRYIRKE